MSRCTALGESDPLPQTTWLPGLDVLSSGCRALLREELGKAEVPSSAEHPSAELRIESQGLFPFKSAGIVNFPSLLASEPAPPQSE